MFAKSLRNIAYKYKDYKSNPINILISGLSLCYTGRFILHKTFPFIVKKYKLNFSNKPSIETEKWIKDIIDQDIIIVNKNVKYASCGIGNLIGISETCNNEIFDALKMNDYEILDKWKMVFYHELGHIKNDDTTKLMLCKITQTSLTCMSLIYVPYLSLIIYFFAELAINKYRRYFEKEADLFACNKAVNIEQLIAFKKIFSDSDSNMPEMFMTHPKKDKRIQYIINFSLKKFNIK